MVLLYQYADLRTRRRLDGNRNPLTAGHVAARLSDVAVHVVLPESNATADQAFCCKSGYPMVGLFALLT